jgi:hypothetical protein
MLLTEPGYPSVFVHPLQVPVIRVLAYYDMFRYPLTADEIFTFLPTDGADELELAGALHNFALDGILGVSKGYYFLPHRDSSVVERRLEMEEQGEKMWRIAQFVGRLMSHVPFVRGVFISGQLCRYLAEKGSDIDFFIVTDPDRLWIVRTFFVTLRRTLLFNRRKFLCTNYFVTTTNLDVRERNQYVACEVASLKPVVNRKLFEEFIGRNRWIESFYPNYAVERMDIRPGVEKPSRLQKALEALVPTRLATRLDIRLMKSTAGFWRRKFPEMSAEGYEKSLRTRRDESRAHAHDQSPIILNAWEETLRRYSASHDTPHD